MLIDIKSDESSSLKQIIYNRPIHHITGQLIVVFKNNDVYKYEKVHLKDFLQLISNTVSIGAPFSNCIKNKYTGIKVYKNKNNKQQGENNENINR
jgi:KTSC domain